MNILYLSPVVPHPQTDGGRQRLNKLAEHLVQKHRVFFVGLDKTGEDAGHWAVRDRLARAPLIVPDRPDGDHPSNVGSLIGLTSWARPAAFKRVEATEFYHSLSLLPLAEIDAIHVATTLVAPFAIAVKRRFPRVQLVLDLPDVAWHMRYRVVTSAEGWWHRRSGLKSLLDTARWFSFERSLIPHFTRVLVCSEIDRQRVARWVNPERIAIVPNGTDVEGLGATEAPIGSRDLVFVGTMSYQPNDEGVRYFSKEVWPEIRRRVPDARFWIVGKDPSESVQRLADPRVGIFVTGSVPTVRPYLDRAVAVVVPLRSGGGTRLKILEAMAAGKPVVSTSIGIEGIDAVPGSHYLLADDPDSFGKACELLLTQPARANEIGRSGRTLVTSKYDWRIVLRTLSETYEGLAQPADSAAPPNLQVCN